MSSPELSTNASRNGLLASLAPADYDRLLPRLQPVALELKRILYRGRHRIDYVYFMEDGVASVMTVMEDGSAIEVATIGNEGMVGLPAVFGPAVSPNEVMVQVAGSALRVDADFLRTAALCSADLYHVLAEYQNVFLMQISQSVACNGLHRVRPRCCRWLLTMHDRIHGDNLPLTHEFLGTMLGVRRPTITEVLQSLQGDGLIRAARGIITVVNRAGLEAASCECYRAVKDEYDRAFSPRR